ncbi:hypothetical protein JHK85_032460 [Glycine max]|nr:hypothetical protein JHK85_032460 [Glycine max]
MVFVKKLSYEIACNVLYDIKDEHTREAMFVDFTLAFKAIHSLPINLPGTTFWRGQRARARIVDRMIPIMNKRREELTNGNYKAKGRNRRVTWAEIQKMKYTWRVAQELMRMIPPLFGSFRKALKETNYEGYDIPKGWQVYWATYGTHMNDDIFENPHKFDPSCFENPPKIIPPYSYLPFGTGLHYYVGNEFASIETLTIIHNFVKMYEWSQVNPEEELVCGSRGSSKELVCRRCPGLFGVLTLHSVWGAHSCSQGVIFSEVIQIDLCPLNA